MGKLYPVTILTALYVTNFHPPFCLQGVEFPKNMFLAGTYVLIRSLRFVAVSFSNSEMSNFLFYIYIYRLDYGRKTKQLN